MAEQPAAWLVTFVAADATPHQFVEFWAPYYNAAQDQPYDAHIRRDRAIGPYTVEAARALFRWKIGERFYASSLPGVERNFIARHEEAYALPPDIAANAFLEIFPVGGAVWRIFWLHCCYPDRFPIYDQHVHRAMTFINEGNRDELDRHSDKRKAELYVTRYLAFHRTFAGCNQRNADRALWVCGKFLKKWSQFPHFAKPRPAV